MNLIRSRCLCLCLLAFAFAGFAPGDQDTKKPSALDSAWNDLASTDESTASRALLALAATQKEALAVLKARLKPVKVDAARVKKLVEQLDDDEFARREEASAELQYLDRFVKPHLEEALKGERSIESKRRIGKLLERLPDDGKAKPPALAGRRISVMNVNGKVQIVIDGKRLDLEALAKPVPAPGPNPLWVRAVRGVALLERIDTPEARALLKELAEGEAGAKPTDAAKAALARLKK